MHSSDAAPEPVLALPGSMYTEHVEVREDRILVYTGWSWDGVQEFRYKARANNLGTFVVAPVYGEAMYRPSIYAQGGPAGTLKVVAPEKDKK